MEQGAGARSTGMWSVLPLIIQSLGSLAWLPGFKAFLVLSSHVCKHFPALPITTNSLLCFVDKPYHFQAAFCSRTRAAHSAPAKCRDGHAYHPSMRSELLVSAGGVLHVSGLHPPEK